MSAAPANCQRQLYKMNVSFVHSDGCVTYARFLGRLGKRKDPERTLSRSCFFWHPCQVILVCHTTTPVDYPMLGRTRSDLLKTQRVAPLFILTLCV